MRTTPLVLSLLALSALTALPACDGDKADADGDGVEGPADCDDNDPKVKPGAAELCDGIDNNCDGQVDEGVGTTFYVDADGDGVGTREGTPARFCVEEDTYDDGGTLYSVLSTDCDDADATIYPGATEDCSVIDRNCDGDPFGGASDLTEWFVDNDDDGYGDAAVSVTDCAAPIGYVDNDEDCNDLAPSINPGADEVCNGTDDDCDGATDDNAIDMVIAYVDDDEDGYGDPATEGLYCLNAGYVEDNSDCDDTDDTIKPSARDICDGIDNDCNAKTDENEVDGDFVYPDLDLDGFGDEAAGAWRCDTKGFIEDGGDCDDSDEYINPDADELCDAADRDCDSDPYDGALDATVYYADADGDGLGADFSTQNSCTGAPKGYPLTTGGDCDDNDPYVTDFYWYVDSDGDGFGDDTVAQVVGCTQPSYTSTTAGDCDDSQNYTYPGAPELCDSLDNDCDPLTDENVTAAWYEDADYDGYGDDAQVYFGCDPASSGLINPIQVGGDCDDADPTLNPVDTPICEKDHCGTIAGSEVWKAGVIHYVTCDVQVTGSDRPRLTIEDGSTVFFDPSTKIRVGTGDAGSIDVQGTNLGVLFTSIEKVPQEGDYGGLSIESLAEDSTIDGLTIQFAGGNGNLAGLKVNTSEDLTVRNSTFRRNAGDGLRVTGGFPLVHDSTFVLNEGNGVYVAANQGLSRLDSNGTPGPSFTDNYINQNGGRPISVPGSHADELDPLTTILDDTSSGAGNTIPEIELLGGTMRSAGAWAAHQAVDGTGNGPLLPYYVASNATITVADAPTTELTINDGVEVYWDSGAQLDVGVGAAGRLVIGDEGAGTPSSVLFSATDDLIINGLNWDGVTFGTLDNDSYINGLVVEFGGANNQGNLAVNDSGPNFQNITSRFSDSNGIYITGANATPLIQNSNLVDNDQDGVFVNNGSGIARVDEDEQPARTFSNNTCTGNGFAPIRLPPNLLGELDDTTTFSGNGELITVFGGTVLETALWRKLDEDYYFEGTVQIGGPQDPIVEIDPGVRVEMARDVSFTVGRIDDGTIIIDAATDPVILESADVQPGPGDWFGLIIGDNGALFQQTSIDGLIVNHAGGSDVTLPGGAIELDSRNTCGAYSDPVTLSNVVVNQSSKMGFLAGDTTQVHLRDWEINTPYEGYCLWFITEPNDCPAVLLEHDNIICNGSHSGKYPGGSIGVIDPNDTFVGGIIVDQTAMVTDDTWPSLNVPYQMLDNMVISSGAELTIDDGVIIEMDEEAGLTVGGGPLSTGSLTAVGAATTLQQASGPWEGITINYGTLDLQNLTIDGAGALYDGGIVNLWGSGTIANVNMVNTANACDYYDRNIEDNGGVLQCAPTTECIIPNPFSGTICYP